MRLITFAALLAACITGCAGLLPQVCTTVSNVVRTGSDSVGWPTPPGLAVPSDAEAQGMLSRLLGKIPGLR